MHIVSRARKQSFRRGVWLWLAVCQFAWTGLGQQATTQPAPGATPAAVRNVAYPDGPWRFHTGDDPSWAEPSFNDSNWQAIDVRQSLAEQGIDSYNGYAWYRLTIPAQQVAQFRAMTAGQPLALLVNSNSVGQMAAYVNGYEVGHTRGMTDAPAEYQSAPVVAQFPTLTPGPVVIAIRTWVGPSVTVARGILQRVEIGGATDLAERQAMTIGRQWNERVIATAVLTFLFFCVAVLGTFLYLAQRHHAEYLWLVLMCLSVAASGAAETAYGLGVLRLGWYHGLSVLAGHVFMAITLEFVLHFTATKSRKLVRGVQIAVLVIPLFYFVHLFQLFQYFAVAAEVVFCAVVTVLLFHAWRRGRTEAGVMLVPFFLAAAADSADTVLEFLAFKHWLPESFMARRFFLGPIAFSTGGIAYTIFLASLIAVILYRFVRISQEEQRSAAEISAARSVQALLIPTQLPSNKNFMLESAYLPVNGVGGDFFQVLPQKDDSLLIVVGDVSGKGLQAAMNSSTLVGALRNELSHDPATILTHLNHVLIGAVASPGTAVKELDCAPCYATCLCARVYPDGTVVVANAGHLNPYRDGREMMLAPSLPLGVIADAEYEAIRFQLNRGDRLVFLSDGVVEAMNSEGEMFGFERTQQVSNESARYIAQTAKHFGQTDDITVLSLYLASKTAQPSGEELAYR